MPMKDEVYDPSNEWHENANLVFGFQCNDCDAAIGYGDTPSEKENDHLEFSVACAKLAQELGWSKIDTLKFRCPKCSKNPIKSI
jgi:hypothetical protein